MVAERIQAELNLIRQAFPDHGVPRGGPLGMPAVVSASRRMEQNGDRCSLPNHRWLPGSTALWVLRPFGNTVQRYYSEQLHGPGLQSTPIWRNMGLVFMGAD